MIPFYGYFSFNLRRNLRHFLSHAYPQVDFRFVFRTIERIGSRFIVKDKLPIELSSNIVYKFSCSCCDATYIGKTNRHFGVRVSEHIGQSVRTGKTIQPQIESAIQQQFKTTGHIRDKNNFKIIDRANNDFTTHIKEALHITTQKPKLNAQLDQPFLMMLQN